MVGPGGDGLDLDGLAQGLDELLPVFVHVGEHLLHDLRLGTHREV